MALSGWEKVGRSDPYYKACLATSTGLGGYAGNLLGGLMSVPTGGTSFAAVPVGLAIGFVAGYLACPHIAPAARAKLEAGIPLSEHEIRPAAEALASYADVRDAADAIRLLTVVKATGPRSRSALRCDDPGYAARQILRGLA